MEVLKNSTKEAATQERIIFLLECKKASIIPKFIQNTTKNARMISKNHDYQRKVDLFSLSVLKETLQDAFRHQAFLWRQKRRLLQELSGMKHPLVQWTLQEAQRPFWATIEQDRARLQRKYDKLSKYRCLPSELNWVNTRPTLSRLSRNIRNASHIYI